MAQERQQQRRGDVSRGPLTGHCPAGLVKARAVRQSLPLTLHKGRSSAGAELLQRLRGFTSRPAHAKRLETGRHASHSRAAPTSDPEAVSTWCASTRVHVASAVAPVCLEADHSLWPSGRRTRLRFKGLLHGLRLRGTTLLCLLASTRTQRFALRLCRSAARDW